MVVDVGIVKNYIKPKADSTLYNMRKVDLIEYIRTLENNYNVAVSFNENQARYIESLGITNQKWIPGVPPKKGDYLCYFKYEPQMPDAICENTYLGSGRWMSDGDKVTHWMPLPESPKGE